MAFPFESDSGGMRARKAVATLLCAPLHAPQTLALGDAPKRGEAKDEGKESSLVSLVTLIVDWFEDFPLDQWSALLELPSRIFQRHCLHDGGQ